MLRSPVVGGSHHSFPLVFYGRLEGLVTEDDLRQLVGGLGVGTREPEREGWEHVISKGNDDVSYRAWCDKPTVWLAHLPLTSL